jgi:basic membrane protein A and related proteins
MQRFTVASAVISVTAASLMFAGVVAAQEGEAVDASDLRIGLVTDVGTLDDRNFNQYSWEGAVTGAALVGAPQPQSAISLTSADIGPNIQAFVDQGYDIIVTVGFAAGADTVEAARTNPEVKFIGVDQSPCLTEEGEIDPTFTCPGDPAELLPNFQGLNYREQQPGYLAGIVAAHVSETGHIAAIGGTEIVPPVPNYIIGYANGARSVNPDVNVEVFYVSGAPDALAFNDPAAGTAAAQQMLQQNPEIDVFFQVAGKTGNGVLQAACDAGIWAIGVDVDQYLSTPETASCTIVSAEKKLTASVASAIQRIAEGTDEGGALFLEISTGDVGLSPFHEHEDVVPEEALADIEAAAAALADGSLEACEADPVTGFCIIPDQY